LVFAVIGYATLVPIAMANAPFAERLVNVGYPLLDLVALIPTLVLLRITLRFRGGQVWRVWGVLLVGILCAMGGDVLFADTSSENAQKIGPLADLAFTLGYALCAYGARLQFELVARD
jgi:hypothetical protein